MGWAARRRFIILFIVGAIGAAFLAVVLIATFYKTPSCTDGVQNQGEAGIDCGGSCTYLCLNQEQPPTVLFTKVLSNGEGRTDVIALVQNKNATAAAKNVPYRITLYNNKHVLIREIDSTLDLPPAAEVPIFISGVAQGTQKITSAFLEIDASTPRWFVMATDTRVVPTVVNTTRGGTANTPRISAVFNNSSVVDLSNVQAIVLVYDARKNIIAASKTLIPIIPAQGEATGIFTWNGAFVGTPASIRVMPIIPLPAQASLP